MMNGQIVHYVTGVSTRGLYTKCEDNCLATNAYKSRYDARNYYTANLATRLRATSLPHMSRVKLCDVICVSVTSE